jgi:hypothetical protein
MAAIRVLNDGRLALADGTKLDLDVGWLSQLDARSAAEAADLVVFSDVLSSTDISQDSMRIQELLDRVTESGRPVGARRYRGSNMLALVLTRSH